MNETDNLPIGSLIQKIRSGVIHIEFLRNVVCHLVLWILWTHLFLAKIK